MGVIDCRQCAEWLQVNSSRHDPVVLKMSVHSLKVLEFVNCGHEGLASLQRNRSLAKIVKNCSEVR